MWVSLIMLFGAKKSSRGPSPHYLNSDTIVAEMTKMIKNRKCIFFTAPFSILTLLFFYPIFTFLSPLLLLLTLFFFNSVTFAHTLSFTTTMTAFQMTPHLYDKIKYFAKFPQTGVSLRQMVMFGKTMYLLVLFECPLTVYIYFFFSIGQNPSQGTLFKASQFLHGKEHPARQNVKPQLI